MSARGEGAGVGNARRPGHGGTGGPVWRETMSGKDGVRGEVIARVVGVGVSIAAR